MIAGLVNLSKEKTNIVVLDRAFPNDDWLGWYDNAASQGLNISPLISLHQIVLRHVCFEKSSNLLVRP